MNHLIVNNDNYVDMLRKSPGLTIYQKVDRIDSAQAVKLEEVETQKFIKRQPAYVSQILQRMSNEYEVYKRSEQPQIRNMQSNPMYVHSSAGPTEIDILNHYKSVQRQIQSYKRMINVKA